MRSENSRYKFRKCESTGVTRFAETCARRARENAHTVQKLSGRLEFNLVSELELLQVNVNGFRFADRTGHPRARAPFVLRSRQLRSCARECVVSSCHTRLYGSEVHASALVYVCVCARARARAWPLTLSLVEIPPLHTTCSAMSETVSHTPQKCTCVF